MGKGRFLYNNYITEESMLSVNSLSPGFVSFAIKSGQGTAEMVPTGNYSYQQDLEYVVKIHDVAAGSEVGQAKYKWSDDGGLTWEATGVTSASITASLNNNVLVRFVGGTGADFYVDDKWTFRAVNYFNPGKLIDGDRDSVFRTATMGGTVSVNIDLTFAASVSPTALVLFDHNLNGSSYVRLVGDRASCAATNPDYRATIFWNEALTPGNIVEYLSGNPSYKYWRLFLRCDSIADKYIEASELFLGTYFEPARNFTLSPEETFEIFSDELVNDYGVIRDKLYNYGVTEKSYTYPFMSDADLNSLKLIVASTCDRSTNRLKKFFFHEDADVTSKGLYLVKFDSSIRSTKDFNNINNVEITLKGILKSV